MNVLDAYVKEVLEPPKEKYGKWWVRVIYDCWGSTAETEIMCQTEEEAKEIAPGHQFLT